MPENSPAPTPHRAIYGYSFYLLFITLYVFYLLWALLPTEDWGLTYLPDKYFAILLPMLVLVGLSFFAFFIYPAINMTLTSEVDEMATVVDVQLILKGKSKKNIQSWSELQQELTPIKSWKQMENFNENCIYCSGKHRAHKESDQISALRFMDLAEINKQFIE